MSGQAMAGVEVKVKFFASGRELAGTDGLVLQLPQSDSNTETVTRVRPLPALIHCGSTLPATPHCPAQHVSPRVLAGRW